MLSKHVLWYSSEHSLMYAVLMQIFYGMSTTQISFLSFEHTIKL